MNLKITVKKVDEIISVLKIKGEMDLYTAPDVRINIEQLLKSGQLKIIMDLSELVYIDSTGLGVFISSLSHVKKKQGNMIFLSPTKPVAKLIRIVGLENVLISYQDKKQAIAALST